VTKPPNAEHVRLSTSPGARCWISVVKTLKTRHGGKLYDHPLSPALHLCENCVSMYNQDSWMHDGQMGYCCVCMENDSEFYECTSCTLVLCQRCMDSRRGAWTCYRCEIRGLCCYAW